MVPEKWGNRGCGDSAGYGTGSSQKASWTELAISAWKEWQCWHLENRKALGLYRIKAKTGELAEDKDIAQQYWGVGRKSLLRTGRQNGRIHAKTKKGKVILKATAQWLKWLPCAGTDLKQTLLWVQRPNEHQDNHVFQSMLVRARPGSYFVFFSCFLVEPFQQITLAKLPHNSLKTHFLLYKGVWF